MAPMTGAERQRRYREKLKNENPTKLAQIKKQNAERTKNKYIKIEDLSESLKNNRRREWRNLKQKHNIKRDSETNNTTLKERRKIRYKLLTENIILKTKIEKMEKVIKKQRKAIFRFKTKLANVNKALNNLEKELETVKKTGTHNIIYEEVPTTPLSKTESFLKNTNIPSADKNKVKKAIFEGYVLKESLKNEYSNATNNSEKNIYKKIINNDTVNKYNLKTNFSNICLGLKGKLRQKRVQKNNNNKRIKEIHTFLERDDNSRLTAGKKETKTYKKDKKQVRYLLNSLQKLHQKYKAEGGLASYTTFTRHKPFYILDPTITQRNTCACVKHANLNFLAQKLKTLGILVTDDLDKLVSEIVCNKLNEKCMYDECESCENKTLSINLTQQNKKKTVSWNAWVTRTHEYSKNGIEGTEKKITKRTTKDVMEGTLETLVNTFSDQLQKFKKHYYNIYHGYQMYKRCKENLKETDCIIHCDFSENYLCKSHEEVQATHFGASKVQITLHTGVIYYKNNNQSLQQKSFCTISPNNSHGPVAIWAHLTPVLEYIKESVRNVNIVHFFSDGPTSQYKQKGNFYLLSEMAKKFGLERATWTFFESAHGKGAADGIGGAVKRKLDKSVSYGADINNAEMAYDFLRQASKIKYFYISDLAIKTLEQTFDFIGLVPVPQTMSIHQVHTTDQENVITYRKLACFCTGAACNCYNLQEHNLKLKRKKQQNEEKRTKKYIKKRKIDKSKKQSTDIDDSETSTESNITYAESDDSIWNLEDDKGFDDENENENMTEEQNEKTILEDNNIFKKSDINDKKKVTLLSVIKNTPDNQKYFNLKNYCPLMLQKVDKIQMWSKENKTNLRKLQNNIHKVTKTDESYTENEEKENKTDEKNKVQQKIEAQNKPKTREEFFKKNKKFTNNEGINLRENKLEEENDIEELNKVQEKTEGENETDATNQLQKNFENNKAEDPTKLQETMYNNNMYHIDDTVLVRYYEKKKWVYYIGFIENIEIRTDNTTYYIIRFLKTVRKPNLKFVITKKIDKDTVPIECIVKIVEIKVILDAYILKNECDHIYFD